MLLEEVINKVKQLDHLMIVKFICSQEVVVLTSHDYIPSIRFELSLTPRIVGSHNTFHVYDLPLKIVDFLLNEYLIEIGFKELVELTGENKNDIN